MTDFNKKSLLENSTALVKQGYYSKAFKVFEHLPAKEFIDFTTGTISVRDSKEKLKGPFQNTLANRTFWKEIVCADKTRLAELVNCEAAFTLFKNYFRDTANINDELLQFLSEQFPVKLIQFIRTNEAFLNEAHFKSFAFLENNSNDYLRLHYKCFVFFRNTISSYTKQEKELAENLARCEFWDGFIRLTLLLEKVSFERVDFYFLQSAGGAFVHVLKWHKKLGGKISDFKSIEEFEMLQMKHLQEAKAKGDDYFKNPFIEALNFIERYRFFYDNAVLQYSYNLNTEPRVTQSGSVELDYVNYDEQYNWKINGLMYHTTWQAYLQMGTLYVQGLIQEGKYPFRGKTGLDREVNVQLSCDRHASQFMLDDLNIKSIPVTDSVPIDVERILLFIYPFITWGKSRRSVAYHTGATSWIEHVAHITGLNMAKGVPVFPVRMDDKEALFKMAKGSGNQNDNYEDIVPLFTTKITDEGSSKFSPYQPLVDLFYKPILEINGKYYTLTLMLEGSNPFITVYGAFTDAYEKERQSVIKEENNELEKAVAKAILETGVLEVGNSIKYFSKDISKRELGDIDGCFILNGELILLELKRTKYRLNDEQRWIEKQGTINKAAEQLNRAEKYLRENPDFLKEEGVLKISTESIRIKKYICTTSPEFRATVVDGCEVISIQEFIYTLKYTIGFSQGVEKTELLADYFKNGGFQLQLTQEEMELRRTNLFFTNEETGRAYNDKFNEAADAYRNGKLDIAIQLWKECLTVDSEDASNWSALGNCYADQKKYDEALRCFNHALNLTSNDYLILANRAVAYLEMGNPVEYFKDLVTVMKIYKTGSEVLKNTLTYFIQKRILKPDEIIEISKLLEM